MYYQYSRALHILKYSPLNDLGGWFVGGRNFDDACKPLTMLIGDGDGKGGKSSRFFKSLWGDGM